MTSPVRVEVKGLPELERGLGRLAGDVDEAAHRAAQIVADQVAAGARSSVPRLTGRLASSVFSERTERGAELGMGAGLAYANWIEFGGSRGRPLVPEGRYLVGPANAQFPDYVRRVSTALDDTIGGFNWPTPH